jgi:hypothetical protein
MSTDLVIRMDVGSTTVKAVVVHPDTRARLCHHDPRHQTRQPETALSFFERIVDASPDQPAERWRVFLTGPGAGPLCDPTGGAFVQEVNAVTLAVEQAHPDVLSVVELGVLQNLSVLTRGSTLRPKVLLLGGPNTYLPFLQDCWPYRIPETWRDRGIEYPTHVPIEELIFVPPQAELYATLGAAYYGLAQDEEVGRLHGLASMRALITNSRRAVLLDSDRVNFQKEGYRKEELLAGLAMVLAAHHPNVAVLDLSSFKCGHDAPTYGLIDTVLQTAKTPASALHDLGATKPGGSILIRVKTYAHPLRLQQERVEELAGRRRELAQAIDEKRLTLLLLRSAQLDARGDSNPLVEREIKTLKERMRAYAMPAAWDHAMVGARRGGRRSHMAPAEAAGWPPRTDREEG